MLNVAFKDTRKPKVTALHSRRNVTCTGLRALSFVTVARKLVRLGSALAELTQIRNEEYIQELKYKSNSNITNVQYIFPLHIVYMWTGSINAYPVWQSRVRGEYKHLKAA